MAIAPGSYSFMGGAVLGKGSERQFVLVRSGSLLTAFTDDEYSACLEAVHDGKAVCVQYKIGPVTFQTQLLNVTGLGDLQLVDTSVQSITHYRVAGTSPHTVSIVKTGSAQQFVLERDDMSTAFTASEYIQCQSRVSEGSAVCVQWKSGSGRMQAQLSAMLADGAMLFSFTSVDLEMIFIVSGSDPHNITAHTNSLGGGVVVFEVSYSESISDYVYPTYQEVKDAVSAGKIPVILKYIHNSPVRRCFVFQWLSGGYIYLDNNSQYVKISNANVVETGYINDKNLAADYDPTATYGVGNYCVYHNELFVCTTDIKVAEEWDGSHWQRTSMSDIVGNVETLLAAL